MARSLGMAFRHQFERRGLGVNQYSPVKDREKVRSESGYGVASFTEFRERYGRDLLVPCQDLWFRPQVNWDGKLLGCCVNMWGDFGNVFDSGFDECLASEKYTYTQRMLLGEVAPRSDSPCIHCHLYQNDAMTKLVDSMPAPILIRRLLSARIGSGSAQRRPKGVLRDATHARLAQSPSRHQLTARRATDRMPPGSPARVSFGATLAPPQFHRGSDRAFEACGAGGLHSPAWTSTSSRRPTSRTPSRSTRGCGITSPSTGATRSTPGW
jgi:hypothetical protein